MNKKASWNPFELQYVQAVCQNVSPKVLASYFHQQGLLAKVELVLLRENSKKKIRIIKRVLELLTTLEDSCKEKILTDFKMICFFVQSPQQVKEQLLNLINSNDPIFGLLHTKETNNKDIIKDIYINNNIHHTIYISKYIYDWLLCVLVSNKQEFYHYYCLHSHLELQQAIWTIRKDYYNSNINLTKEFLQHHLEELKRQIGVVFNYQPVVAKSAAVFIDEFNNNLFFSLLFNNYFSTIEANFVINRESKTIAVSATRQGYHQQLHSIFAKVVFKVETSPSITHDQLFDLPLILQYLLTNGSSKPLIKGEGIIEGFYINRLTLADSAIYQEEITLNTKHIEYIQAANKVLSANKVANNSLNHFTAFLEPYKSKNSTRYVINSIEIIAIIKLPQLDISFRKRFMLNNQNQTDLSFNSNDEQIKDCLRAANIMNDRIINSPPIPLFFAI